MEAFVQQQNRSSSLGKRFDYVALAPAAAALCYPFLLRAFHAIVGSQAATPSPLAIVGAILVLAVAFVVPFLGLALAFRPTATVGARRLAYASVAAPTLYVFLGVVQALVHSPISDEIVWCVIWLAIAIWSQSARNLVAAPVPAVGRWRVAHGLTAAILCLYVLFHLTNHLFGLVGPDAHATVMKIGRVVYRSGIGEPLLVAAMLLPDRHRPLSRMALERRRTGLTPDISGRLGCLSLAVHPRAHELGLHLRPLLSRHTDRLEFRDRRPNRAHP